MDNYDSSLRPWPMSWSAVWIGALAAVAVGLLIGLLGYAMGAHEVAKAAAFKHVRATSLIFSIAGAFFAFVVGGWIAGRMSGYRRSEPAILHGAMAWLLTVPMMLTLGALGAVRFFGGWWGGFSANPAFTPIPGAVDTAMAEAMRNNALAAFAALALGLIGAVIGGWMASGEPMTLTYYRRRDLHLEERPRRIA